MKGNRTDRCALFLSIGHHQDGKGRGALIYTGEIRIGSHGVTVEGIV